MAASPAPAVLDGNSSKSRASAKEGVKSAWAERRLRSPPPSLSKGNDDVGGGDGDAAESRDAAGGVASGELPNEGARIVSEAAISDAAGVRSGNSGCSDLRRTWRDLQASLTRAFDPRQEQRRPDGGQPPSERSGTPPLDSESERTSERRKRASETSRYRLVETTARLQTAAAVAAEVSALGCVDGGKDRSRSDNDGADGDRPYVSVLPAGFDQSLALTFAASDRRRAFLLLDLARVASAHRTFHSYASGPGVYARDRTDEEMRAAADRRGKSVHIAPQFRVMANRDAHLLTLLARLGVGLRCGGGADVEEARAAVRRAERGWEGQRDGGPRQGTEGWDPVVVDDAGRTRKPDGYLRRLVFPPEDDAASGSAGPSGVDVAVDGPDEVRRVRSALRRFQRRRGSLGGDGSAVASCRFILRIPPYECEDKSIAAWKELMSSTLSAVKEEGCASDFAGVSVDMSPWETALRINDKSSADDKEETFGDPIKSDAQDILHSICTGLRWVRLFCIISNSDSSCRQRMRIDLTGLPQPLTRHVAEALTSTLATVVSCPLTDEELLSTLRSSGAKCGSTLWGNAIELDVGVAYTADITHHLVSDAGALCARIIGIKRATSEDDDTRAHVYIDDGCYGSLSSCYSSKCNADAKEANGNTPPSDREFRPIPLYGSVSSESMTPENAAPLRPGDEKGPTAPLVRTTVWGPTCDGLDRVCEATSLPDDLEVNRDWLVFPHMGCGGFGGGLGLGTAFNGFDSPETVYCMLGYFSGYSDDRFKVALG